MGQMPTFIGRRYGRIIVVFVKRREDDETMAFLSVNDPFVKELRRKRNECIQGYIESGVKEIWTPVIISGYDYSYSISNLSRVVRTETYHGRRKNDLLTPRLRVNGSTKHPTWSYYLSDNGMAQAYSIIDLVGTHFISKRGYNNKNEDMFSFYNIDALWDTTVFNIISDKNIDKRRHPKRIDLKRIHQACVCLETNYGTQAEIAEYCGISIASIRRLISRRDWTDISKYYNIDNYTSKQGYHFTSAVPETFPSPTEDELDALLSYMN